MNEPLLFAGVRTPIGKYLGTLADLPAPQLAAQALKATLARSGAPALAIDEVILGQVLQAGVGQ
ncbi:MAG: acetyl-CoA C-acyltransferase, partial [Planctomycetota bacterium]